jgi:excisionase family DNA binding protein
MPEFKDTQYLTTAEVAEAIQVTKATIKNWLRAKKIPEPRRHPGNGYRQWTLIRCGRGS